MNFTYLAMAPPSDGGQSSGFLTFLPLILILFLMYFLLLRPQAKRQKEQDQMRGQLKKGDQVVTTSGMFGTVTGLDDKTVEVRIANNVKVKFLRNAIAAIDTGNVSKDVVEE